MLSVGEVQRLRDVGVLRFSLHAAQCESCRRGLVSEISGCELCRVGLLMRRVVDQSERLLDRWGVDCVDVVV